MHQDRLYFDYNATTPPSPELVAALPEILAEWGNPSSSHQRGQRAAALLDRSREAILRPFGPDYELIFTSGGSESNRLALEPLFASAAARSDATTLQPRRRRILCSAVEHPSIGQLLAQLAPLGYQIERLAVDRHGRLDETPLRSNTLDDIAQVIVMAANNESGTLFDVVAIASYCAAAGIPFHCDVVQLLGKVEAGQLDLTMLSADTIAISAHKIYGLKGSGALLLHRRHRQQLRPLIAGSQEGGLRGGTENLPGIAAFAFAIEQLDPSEPERLARLRDQFEERYLALHPGCDLVASAPPCGRLANTSAILLPPLLTNDFALMELDRHGFALSAGAACHSGHVEPSTTIQQMGYSAAEAGRMLRLSLGRFTDEEALDTLLQRLQQMMERL